MEDAPLETVVQRERHELRVLFRLGHLHAVAVVLETVRGREGRERLLEIDVVLDVLQRGRERRVAVAERGAEPRAELLVEVVVGPPGIAGVVVAEVERGALVAQEAVEVEVEGVGAEGQGEGGIGLDVELTPVCARGADFTQQVVAQDRASLAEDLCAHGEVVLVEDALREKSRGVGFAEVEAGVFVLAEEAQSHLHPAVEALVEFHGQGVLDAEVVGTVVGRVAGEEEVFEVAGVVGVVAFVRLEAAHVVRDAQGVDEARHGDKFRGNLERVRCIFLCFGLFGQCTAACGRGAFAVLLFAGLVREAGQAWLSAGGAGLGCTFRGRRVGQAVGRLEGRVYGGFHFPALRVAVAAEAQAVTVREEELRAFHLVPGAGQVDGHVGRSVARGEAFGAVDEVVVLDAAVFACLEEKAFGVDVQLVLFAAVRGEEGPVEVRGGLPFVVAAAVGIVGAAAEAQLLSRVHREECREPVLTVRLVAAGVVRHVGEGRLRVREEPLAGGAQEIVVGAEEDEGRLLHVVALLGKEARDARRAQVARVVVVAARAVCRVLVLEAVGDGVVVGGPYGAETGVYGPGVDTFGHILLFRRISVRRFLEARGALRLFEVSVERLHVLGRGGQGECRTEEQCEKSHREER